jgi:hypothetical protein
VEGSARRAGGREARARVAESPGRDVEPPGRAARYVPLTPFAASHTSPASHSSRHPLSQGSMELCDVADRLPELRRAPGLTRWKVKDKYR